MKGIYYDGSVEGAGALAKTARAAIPREAGAVRLRDAHAWLQRPEGLEAFASVVIPTDASFDGLAGLYADAGATVDRSDLTPPADAPVKSGGRGRKAADTPNE